MIEWIVAISLILIGTIQVLFIHRLKLSIYDDEEILSEAKWITLTRVWLFGRVILVWFVRILGVFEIIGGATIIYFLINKPI